MDAKEAIEVADRWRGERVISVGNNALPHAVVALADEVGKLHAAQRRIAELEAERDRLIDELRDAEARNAQKLSQIARLRDDAERYRYLKKVFEFACNAAPGLYDDDRHKPHRQSIAIDDAAIDGANEEDFGAALENGDD